jgi:hypothetical protein
MERYVILNLIWDPVGQLYVAMPVTRTRGRMMLGVSGGA